MKDEIFQHLQLVNWVDIGKKLIIYANKRASLYSWFHSEDRLLQGCDFTIDDIVQQVILKTINGERHWDPEKGPLFNWLKLQVKSVMDAWVKQKSGKHEISFDDDQRNEGYIAKSGILCLEDVKGNNNDEIPEECLLDKEKEKKVYELVKHVFQAVSDDPELVELVRFIYHTGETKPILLAQNLGTSVDNINNRKKRCSRRLLKEQSLLEKVLS